MISGMRLRRRSAFSTGSYRFYRLRFTASEGSTSIVRIVLLWMVTEDFPNGEVSGGTPSDVTTITSYPERAFNYPNVSDFWQGDFPSILQYEFAEPQVVTEYRIRNVVQSQVQFRHSPSDFTFEASVDGLTWDVLDTQSGLTWSSGETKTFPL